MWKMGECERKYTAEKEWECHEKNYIEREWFHNRTLYFSYDSAKFMMYVTHATTKKRERNLPSRSSYTFHQSHPFILHCYIYMHSYSYDLTFALSLSLSFALGLLNYILHLSSRFSWIFFSLFSYLLYIHISNEKNVTEMN